MLLFKISILIVQMALVFGDLNEHSAKEKECFDLDTSNIDLDYEWVFANPRWYFNIMSKLDLYRTAWDTLEKATKDLSPNDVETPCIYADWEGMSPTIIGFDGKRLEYDVTPGFDNSFTFGAAWRNGEGGKMYLAKTDNKSYLLFIKCWEHDKQISWNVMSTSPTLDESTKAEIYKTLESYGLSKDFAFEQNFDKCRISQVKNDEL